MSWSPDDADIETKIAELNEISNMLRSVDKKIRVYNSNIHSLFLIPKRVLNDDSTPAVNPDGTPKYEYLPPKNRADEPMDESYRTEQKASLIINIDELVTMAKEKLIPVADLVAK